jgi:hypothetical protein
MKHFYADPLAFIFVSVWFLCSSKSNFVSGGGAGTVVCVYYCSTYCIVVINNN